MKKILLPLLLCLPTILPAQKHDNVWVIGYNSNDNPTDKGSLMHFANNRMQLYVRLKEANVGEGANASICDTAGNLLFFTNGVTVFNKNSDPIVSRLLYGVTGYIPLYGNLFKQSNIFLPMPNYPNQYVLISLTPSFDYFSFGILPFYGAADSLQYSIFDAAGNNGLGSVITLKQHLLADTLDPNSLEVCRHANGRDWWILVGKNHTNLTYRFLLDPQGFHYKGQQPIGNILTYDFGFRQSVFSPNGEWLIRYASNSVIDSTRTQPIGRKTHFYRFDRCSGLLSNPFEINDLRDTTWGGGAAISPNSRFLYVITNFKIYQYDLEATNIPNSRQVVGTWEVFADSLGWRPKFFYAQLAPNGKIYISTTPTTRYLHVIHAPDSQGVACRLEQRAVLLKTYNLTLPTLPNFRMGRLLGSVCDSLRTSTSEVGVTEGEVRIYPNPSQGNFQVSLSGGGVEGQVLSLYDRLGRKVHQVTVAKGEQLITIQTQNLVDGVYWLLSTVNGQVNWTHQVMISK